MNEKLEGLRIFNMFQLYLIEEGKLVRETGRGILQKPFYAKMKMENV